MIKKILLTAALMFGAIAGLQAQQPGGMTSAQLAGFSFRMPEVRCSE